MNGLKRSYNGSVVHTNMTKSIFTSKTFWLAIIQALIGIVVAVQIEMPEVGGLLLIKSVLDMSLRFVTIEPVKL